MKTFTVRVEQWVQEIALLDIEAETPEEAKVLAENMEHDGDIDDWEDGSSIDSFAVAQVMVGNDVVWTPTPPPLPKIHVVMEGGVCQCVSVDLANSGLIGGEYIVIDYDTDGAEELSDIRQTDGTIAEAIVSVGVVDLLEVEILGPAEEDDSG